MITWIAATAMGAPPLYTPTHSFVGTYAAGDPVPHPMVTGWFAAGDPVPEPVIPAPLDDSGGPMNFDPSLGAWVDALGLLAGDPTPQPNVQFQVCGWCTPGFTDGTVAIVNGVSLSALEASVISLHDGSGAVFHEYPRTSFIDSVIASNTGNTVELAVPGHGFDGACEHQTRTSNAPTVQITDSVVRIWILEPPSNDLVCL